MPRSTDSDRPIKSVDTTLQIIETIKKRDGARLTEIAETLTLPKSTVSDHLITLQRNHYLIKSGNEYRLGLRFLELGDHARNYDRIYNIGKQKIDGLAEECGELVHLSVEENGRGVIIYETEGDNAVSLDTYIGRRVPLHCTALGKAMLASMTDERIDEIIERFDLTAETEQTVTDRDNLYHRLTTVSERGYAISDGERIAELGCVAAPIKDADRNLVFGAVSVCVPMTRMESERFKNEIPQAVQQIANRIELDLIYQ